MRLLTLAALGFKNIGQNLSYVKIAEALEVDISEVEKWVIDSMLSFFRVQSLSLNNIWQ
jgi:hypothetical protein